MTKRIKRLEEFSEWELFCEIVRRNQSVVIAYINEERTITGIAGSSVRACYLLEKLRYRISVVLQKEEIPQPEEAAP